ncbi:MAG: hypothetical protein MOB07_16375 [Acidobacteria bacterium]|nr:hypothetical protein [Acidobacteriota bacterium]
MNHIETDTDILQLAVEGNDHEAMEVLRQMTPAELRELRQACSRLDEWLDDAILDRHQTKGGQR